MRFLSPYKLVFRRFVAYLVDFILLAIIILVFQLALSYLTGFPSSKHLKTSWQIYAWVLFSVSLPIYLYFIISERSGKQATLGKNIWKIKIVSRSGGVISTRQSILRSLVKIAIPWEITHISILFPRPLFSVDDPNIPFGIYLVDIILLLYLLVFILTKGKMTIHDYLSNTRAIFKN
jgi:uncharacterized RDD family membrane protein YckC